MWLHPSPEDALHDNAQWSKRTVNKLEGVIVQDKQSKMTQRTLALFLNSVPHLEDSLLQVDISEKFMNNFNLNITKIA